MKSSRIESSNMGHKSFHSYKPAKAAKQQGAPPHLANDRYLLDSSFLMHVLHYRTPLLAYQVAMLRKSSPDCHPLARRYADALISIAAVYGNGIWVFESRTPGSKTSDPAKDRRRQKTMITASNKSYSACHSERKEGKRGIAFAIGRPMNWFTALVIANMRKSGKTVLNTLSCLIQL